MTQKTIKKEKIARFVSATNTPFQGKGGVMYIVKFLEDGMFLFRMSDMSAPIAKLID